MKIQIGALTKRELDTIIAEANFTKEQRMVFDEFNKDEVYDYAIMMNLAMSSRKYYEVKKTTVDKVVRISKELGYNHIIK